MLASPSKQPALAAMAMAAVVTSNAVHAQLGAPPPQKIVDFVNKQFDDFFADCESFVDSFRDGFLWCNAEPCFRNRAKLLKVCKNTEGVSNTVHGDLVLKPASFPTPPNWEEFAIDGQQTVCLSLGAGPAVPLCFDFTITEKVEPFEDAPFGIKSKEWKGYYNLNVGTRPGFDPVVCA